MSLAGPRPGGPIGGKEGGDSLHSARFMERPSSHFTLADESLVTLLGGRVKGVWEGGVAFALRLTDPETGKKQKGSRILLPHSAHRGTSKVDDLGRATSPRHVSLARPTGTDTWGGRE